MGCPGPNRGAPAGELDAVVVGAGFSEVYMLHRRDKLGLSARVFEAAEDVGGPGWDLRG